MDLHLAANLEWNLYRACDPWHTDQDWIIEHREAEYVYTHIRVAHLLLWGFEFSQCHQVAQVAFWASVASVVVDVHPRLCTSCESVDSLLCHFGKEGSHPFDFPEPLPGVIPSQPSACYAQETQHPVSSLLELRRVVSRVVVGFPQLGRAKTLLYPFWPYSRQDACQTVQAVPDLLVLP